MKNKYRIVKDCYRGFEVQFKRWWFPMWFQCHHIGSVNSFNSLESAKKFIELHRKGLSGVIYSE